MEENKEKIKEYYDEHISGKIKGFININERVERAWRTIIDKVKNPKNVLEIGCGIGDICWRMSEEWTNSKIFGIDISPRSIEYAKKLFERDRVVFKEGILNKDSFQTRFDLIVLMDVYEHIAETDRPELHDAIKNLISEDGQVFLSFPTPRHLAWLRRYAPAQIQPVDEDILIETITNLAKDINKEVLLYKEISVWHRGDYVHVILGSNRGWCQESDRIDNQTNNQTSLINIIKNKIFTFKKYPDLKQERIDLVKEKLNVNLNTCIKIDGSYER